jgi:hypothetical protein
MARSLRSPAVLMTAYVAAFICGGPLAPHGINVAALATDWALWGVSILLVLYLVQVSRSREDSEPGRPALGPIPASR